MQQTFLQLANMMLFNTIYNLFFAKAGEASMAVQKESTGINMPDIFTCDGEEVRTEDYLVFQVIGESMAISRIFDKDYILVDKKIKVDALELYDIIILRIEDDNSLDRKFKVRKFIMEVNIDNDPNNIFNSLLNIDIRSQFDGNKERFLRKYSLFKENKREKKALLSITYKEGERDYSFHTLDQFVGRVAYKIKKNNDLNKLLPIDRNSDDSIVFKDVVDHLSNGCISRFFYGISNEQAIIVLSAIFKSSKEKIKLVSNKLSKAITGDEEYRRSLEIFLEKKNTKLYILVYKYESNNSIYSLLNKYSDKVYIKENKTSSVVFKNKVINFCVGDDSIFRLETDCQSRLSECNFNDKKSSQLLLEKFDQIYNDESSYKIQL